MTNLLSNWELFYPQLILGCLLGGVLSSMGILLVLRKLTFFGVTLSQGVSFSVAICLFFGLKGEIYPILFSSLFILPLLTFRKIRSVREDVVLGILFVFFASASQLLLSLGGNVQNHLLSAYFGDILTSQVRLNSISIVIVGFSFFLFLSFFRRFLFISFDPDEYKIQVGASLYFDFLFFLILSATLSVAVNLLGTYYSVAHLLIPVFTFLGLIRSLRLLTIFCFLFSILATMIGFSLSLFGMDYHGELIYFPTSSTIVIVLIGLSLIVFILSKLRSFPFSRLFR